MKHIKRILIALTTNILFGNSTTKQNDKILSLSQTLIKFQPTMEDEFDGRCTRFKLNDLQVTENGFITGFGAEFEELMNPRQIHVFKLQKDTLPSDFTECSCSPTFECNDGQALTFEKERIVLWKAGQPDYFLPSSYGIPVEPDTELLVYSSYDTHIPNFHVIAPKKW